MAVVLGTTSLTGFSASNLNGNTGATARAMRFTAAADATVTSIEMYRNSAYDVDARLKFFIANSSGTRMALSDATEFPYSGGDVWIGASISSVSITAGQDYYIGWYSDGTYGAQPGRVGLYTTGSGSYNDSAAGTYTTPGTSFSFAAGGDPSFAIRASGTIGSPATISTISDSTPNHLGSLTITGTGFPTSQTGSAGITIGGVAQTVTWNTSTSCSISSIDIGTNKFGTSVDIIVTDASGNASTGYATTFSPRSGGAYVDLSGTMASSGVRLVASPDIAAGDQIEYYGAIGGTIPADVTVNNDGTYDTAAAVTGFYWRVWTAGGGWGAAAFETVDHAAVSSGDTGALFKTMMGSLFKTLLEAS